MNEPINIYKILYELQKDRGLCLDQLKGMGVTDCGYTQINARERALRETIQIIEAALNIIKPCKPC